MISRTSKIILLIIILGLGSAVAFWLLSNKGQNRLLAYIPDDAMVIVKTDLPQLAEIFSESKEELSQYSFFKDRSVGRSSTTLRILQSVIKDPEASGIDFETPMFSFFHSNLRGNGFATLFGIRDESGFARLVKKQVVVGGDFGESDNTSYAELESGVFMTWSHGVGMLSYNKSEGKNYPLGIFRKKGVNIISDKDVTELLNSKSLISATVRLDPIFAQSDTSQIKNPFSKGSRFFSDLDIAKNSINTSVEFISASGKDSAFYILNAKGTYERFRKKIFGKKYPIYALSLSVDLKSVEKLIQKIYPDFFKTPVLGNIASQIPHIWNGDVTLGISMDTTDTTMNPYYDENYSELGTIPDNMSLIAHIGVGDSVSNYLEKYLGPEINNSEVNAVGNLGYYMLDKNSMTLVISNHKSELDSLKNGTFQSYHKNFHDNAVHMSSPFYLANSTENFKYSTRNISPFLPQAFSDMLNDFKGYSYCWVDKSKMVTEFKMNNNKTHPLVLFLRVIEEFYLMDKNGGDPFTHKSTSTHTKNKIPLI